MTFKILIFAHRKQGTTPAQFRDHYENKHMPLVKELTGAQFPLSHVRRYLHRTEDGEATPATLLKGKQSDAAFDVVSEVTFEDEKALQTFYEILQRPENAERMKEDGLAFQDGDKATVVVLGEVNSTER